MSTPYLISYDIANPNRLVRLHRALKRLAVPVQYSLFLAYLTQSGFQKLEVLIDSLVDARVDDVRIYPLPVQGWSCQLGQSSLPCGLFYTGLPAHWYPLPGDRDGSVVPESFLNSAPQENSLTISQKVGARMVQSKIQTGCMRGLLLIR